MSKYKIGHEGYESSFEDEEGEVFSPKKNLGKGLTAIARKFKSANSFNEEINRTRKVAVLSPVSNETWDEEEIKRKIKFYNKTYPDKYTKYFQDKKRAIVPYIQGKPLLDNKVLELVDNPTERLELFKSIAEAIKSANDKGLVIIDIHSENILYNFKDKKCYLIDGGLAHEIGEPILKGQQESQMHIDTIRGMFPQFAKEIFSITGNEPPAKADPKMDVYAFGVLMMSLIKKEDLTDSMRALIVQCTKKNPNARPTMAEILDNWENLKPSPQNKI